jgi:hypothetical protein
VSERLRLLIADATDALNCAEFFTRRAEFCAAKDRLTGVALLSMLRDRELNRAERYIHEAKVEFQREANSLAMD